MAKNRIKFANDFVLNNNKIGLGTENPSSTLHVVGDGIISGRATATNLSISGVSTFYGNVKFDAGIGDIYNNVGVAGSILVSTGVGVSWTAPFEAGIQGAQGTQGLQGTQGTQGLQGTQGTQGLQGTQGTQGLQGTQGIQGIQGTQGIQGVQGTDGTQGTQGTQGIQGVQGTDGTQGTQGTQGIQGVQGTDGTQGTQGTQGIQGIQGTQGIQGVQGTDGTQGTQGTQGLQGTQGTQGLQGTQGTQGLQGTQGTQGLQGTQGTQGLQGTQGIQGGNNGGFSVSDDTMSNETRYILFDELITGTVTSANVSSTNLQFNPATGTLSATIFTSLSDKTQKTNIKPIEKSIELVKQLEGVRYDWINNQKPSIGVIAQDIEKVLPEVVETNSNGLKSVSYGNIVGVLIEAIKEQQIRIEELERKLNA